MNGKNHVNPLDKGWIPEYRNREKSNTYMKIITQMGIIGICS